jgi:hypothetical protein
MAEIDEKLTPWKDPVIATGAQPLAPPIPD